MAGPERSATSGPRVVIDVRHRLREFDLRVGIASPYERVVLFGPSGSGKSATLQAVAGVLQPDHGCIRVDGQTLLDTGAGVRTKARERRVGYVPQGYALFPHLTVEENIAFGLAGVPRGERARRVEELVRLTGLEDERHARPGKLSGGQRQRVALARALAAGPRILLLDEPFSALDPVLRPRLRDEVSRIQRETGVPALVVTHDLGDAFELAEWIAVLDRGTVLQQAPPDEVFHRPATVEVARLVGMTNLLPARVLAVDAAGVDLEWCGHVLRSEQGETKKRWQPAAGEHVIAGIRPASLMFRLAHRSYDGRQNVLSGRIIREAWSAETCRLYVRVGASNSGEDLEVELPGYAYYRLELDERKDVEMSVRPALVHVMPAPGAGLGDGAA